MQMTASLLCSDSFLGNFEDEQLDHNSNDNSCFVCLTHFCKTSIMKVQTTKASDRKTKKKKN